MVIVHRLGSTGARYYLAAVGPSGGESPALGEAPGQWVGQGAPGGPVTLPALGAWMPDGVGRLPGLDVMFSAPKSVSVLHALAGDDAARAVRRAHDEGVRAGVAYLERHACRVEVRGRVERAHGFIAAAFRHRTSRGDDPHLHTHVVVANAAVGADGRRRALHTPALYRERRGAAATYHLVLRGALTSSLGLQWAEPTMGRADAVAVPEEVRGAFSRRRAAVLMASASMADRRWAEHATRPPRDGLVDYESLTFGWRRRAMFLDWRVPNAFEAREIAFAPVDERLLPATDRWARADVVVALADYWRDGALADAVRVATEQLLASREVVARPSGFTTRAADERVRDVNAALAARRTVAAHPEALDALAYDLARRGARVLLVVRDAQAALVAHARTGVAAVPAADFARAVGSIQSGDVVVIYAERPLPSADLERVLIAAASRHVEVVRGDVTTPARHVPNCAVPAVALRTVADCSGDWTAAPTAGQAGDLALADWLARRRNGQPAVLVAERDEVEVFNARARAALREAGIVGREEVGGFAVGDVVRFTHARPTADIVRHAQGDIVAVSPTSLEVHLFGVERTVRLKPTELRTVVHAHVVPPLPALIAGRGDVFIAGGRTIAQRHLAGATQHRYVTGEAALPAITREPARDPLLRGREPSLARHAVARGAGRSR